MEINLTKYDNFNEIFNNCSDLIESLKILQTKAKKLYGNIVFIKSEINNDFNDSINTKKFKKLSKNQEDKIISNTSYIDNQNIIENDVQIYRNKQDKLHSTEISMDEELFNNFNNDISFQLTNNVSNNKIFIENKSNIDFSQNFSKKQTKLLNLYPKIQQDYSNQNINKNIIIDIIDKDNNMINLKIVSQTQPFIKNIKELNNNTKSFTNIMKMKSNPNLNGVILSMNNNNTKTTTLNSNNLNYLKEKIQSKIKKEKNNEFVSYLKSSILKTVKEKDKKLKNLEPNLINKNPVQSFLKNMVLNKINNVKPNDVNRKSSTDSKSSKMDKNDRDKIDKYNTSNFGGNKRNSLYKNSVDSLNVNNIDMIMDQDHLNNPNLQKNSTATNQMKSVFATDSEVIQQFETNNKRLKQIIFEMNNYPKSMIMINSSLNVIFQNQILCTKLFQDKTELLDKNIAELVADSESAEFNAKINEIQENMKEEDVNCTEMSEVVWPFQDKNENVIQFVCRFKLQQFEDEEGAFFNNLIVQMDTEQQTQRTLSIDPRNTYYLLFMLLIFKAVVFLLFYMPYNIVFGVPELDAFNYWTDIYITILFTIDIVLNFLVAQEDKEKRNYIQDLELIAYNQLQGSFAVDLISTIPIDQIFTKLTVNFSLFKSVRIFKVLKLIKLLRITKIFTFFSNKSYILDSEMSKNFQQLFKRNAGFFELMVQNFQILIAAHFYSILYQQVKDSLLEPVPNSGWVAEQWPTLMDVSPANIQQFLLCENVKIALGLGVMNPIHPVEITLNMAWMFIGLSMFGQGIGNISSYLNVSQAEELEMLNNISFFQEMCEDNAIDPRIQYMVIKDVEDYYKNLQRKKIQHQGQVLSESVMNQLELALYSDFCQKFQLFAKLNISAIRMIKNYSKYNIGKVKYEIDTNISDVMLITQGKLLMYNHDMKFINEQGPNELWGISQFQKFFELKQGQKISHQYERMIKGRINQDISNNSEEQMALISTIQLEIRTLINKFQWDSKQIEPDGPSFTVDEQIKLQTTHSVMSSDDLEQISLPFRILEQIMANDPETFFYIQKFNIQLNETITNADKSKATKNLDKFNNNPHPGFLLTSKEQIQDINMAMQGINSEIDFSSLIGNKIRDFMPLSYSESDILNNVYSNSDMKSVKLIQNEIEVVLDFIDTEQMKLTTGDAEMFDDEEDETQFFRRKKSMVDVRAIQVKVRN